MPSELTNFRLNRRLFFEVHNRAEEGNVFVGDLEWNSDKRKWVCHWSISHIHPEVGVIYGNDAMEAVTKTFDFLSSLIRGSESDGLRIWWQQHGDHGGLVFAMCESRTWEKMPPQAQ